MKNFAGQWLMLRNLPNVQPDPNEFPNFDDNLRQAFRQETEMFFGSIIREDRNVLDLLNADYTSSMSAWPSTTAFLASMAVSSAA